jgi:hypothetical protein
VTHPRTYLRVGLLALFLAGLAVACYVTAEASAQQQSSWGTGILAGRSFPLDTSIHPWGAGGGHLNEAALGAIRGSELFSRRYAGGNPTSGSQPIGHTPGEDNVGAYALQNAYAGLCTSIPVRPGQTAPSAEEWWDLVVTHARYSSVYKDCYWRWVPGGTPERAIIVTAENWAEFSRQFTNPGGVCALGLFAVQELGPWLRHYDVRWLPESRPWCDWTTPTVGQRVEVQVGGARQPGVVSRVSGTTVTIRLDAGGSKSEQFADEGRRWWRVGEQPQPTPTATPPPPVSTPTPQPTATPSSCTPIEPETCPCRESASGRWLAQQIAAWPRNEDGSLRPGQRPAVAVWRLVLAAGEWLAEAGETCPCFRSTGQLYTCLEVE